MARGGIRLVHGLTKSTLITYYSGMKKKKKPKHAFFACIFLNLPVMFFPKFVYMTKNTPFFPIMHVFCTPKRCTRVQCLVLKNNPNYVNFWTSLIPPLTFECPPSPSPGHFCHLPKCRHLALHWHLSRPLSQVNMRVNGSMVTLLLRGTAGSGKRTLILALYMSSIISNLRVPKLYYLCLLLFATTIKSLYLQTLFLTMLIFMILEVTGEVTCLPGGRLFLDYSF